MPKGGSGKTKSRGHIIVERGGQLLAEQVQKDIGGSIEDAIKIREAVTTFTSEDYKNIRAFQRTGVDVDTDAKTMSELFGTPYEPKTMTYKPLSDRIETYIDKAPKWNNGVLYRGVKVSENSGRGFALSDFKVGSKLDMHGTSSWTSSKKVANTFMTKSIVGGVDTKQNFKKVLFELPRTNKGTSISHLSKISAEKEVAISKKATFTIQSVSQSSKGLSVKLKEN